MAPALNPEQAATIKATVPVLAQYGETITRKFYHDMLIANPSLKNIFNTTHQATGHQAQALAGALYAYAANIDNLGALSPALELICHKHASQYIRPEHYEIVGTNLLATMKEVLGDECTPEILGAWGAAYWQLADIMIRKEEGLYDSTRGWTDWKDFKITQKVKESEEITSFYFEPVDSSLKIPVFKPGQYVSVNVWVEELDGGVWQARQYSLSDSPGKAYLRISVKREAGVEVGEKRHVTHPGYISNLLHDKMGVGDVVRLSHPFGDFYFEDSEVESDAPIVLISAGVGLTCLMSILNSVVERNETRKITWIHGAKDSRVRAFKKYTDGLAERHENVQTLYFSSAPRNGEVEGQDYNVKGRINLDEISKDKLYIDNDKTQYFICGPTKFMLDIENKLKSFGIPAERVR